MTRNTKRVVIISIYVSVVTLISVLVYLIIATRPTCYDGKKNQAEKGIDCGGPCHPCEKKITAKDLEVIEKYFVYGGNKNNFDVMIKINNPNNQYGVASFNYKIQLVDQAGNVLSQKTGVNFILPEENKYIIEQNFQSNNKPNSIKFSIDNINWQKFSNYRAEPLLSIYNKNYTEEDGKNKMFGLLKNESYFDFNSIEIDIILRDSNGKPVALGKNEMRTVKSQEQRDFKIIWPYKFSGSVVDGEIRAEANVFDSNNFIKKYLPEQKFQSY